MRSGCIRERLLYTGEVSERQSAAPDEDIPKVQVEPWAERALGSTGGIERRVWNWGNYIKKTNYSES